MSFLLTIVETPLFSRIAPTILSEEEIDQLKNYLARHPEAGAIIPNSSGVRKLRWAASGRGKRGGARVIYYYYSHEIPLYLFSIYAKNQKADLDANELRAARQFAEAIAQELRKRRN